MRPTASESEGKKGRISHLRWIHIANMRVSPKAQREYRPAHAASMASDFDLEALGFPVVNHREGYFWLVDGQHRIGALKLIGWEDQQIQCECYEGLTEPEEAELFLRRDERRPIPTYQKFGIAIVAEREAETEIDRIVRTQSLRVSSDGKDFSVGAVGALRKVYDKGGSAVLGRDLRILRDGFSGDSAAFRAQLIEGNGLVCQRYNGTLDDDRLINALATFNGGALGLLRKAQAIRESNGRPKVQCVAQAVVEVYNGKSRAAGRLEPWFRALKS